MTDHRTSACLQQPPFSGPNVREARWQLTKPNLEDGLDKYPEPYQDPIMYELKGMRPKFDQSKHPVFFPPCSAEWRKYVGKLESLIFISLFVLFVCLFVCLLACLLACLFACLFVVSIYIYIYLMNYLSIDLSI